MKKIETTDLKWIGRREMGPRWIDDMGLRWMAAWL